MPRVTFLNDQEKSIEVPAGTSILDAAKKAHAQMGYACGGVCACSTCHVYVKKGLASLSKQKDREEDILDKAFDVRSNSRLGCQSLLAAEDVEVEISRESRQAFFDEHPDELAALDRFTMARIYFDHNATTPLHPSVFAAISEAATRHFGNPSSLHEEGRAARQLVERGRAEVSTLIGASPTEMVFTSGGTESNSSAILCGARAVAKARGQKGQVISSPLEHPSVSAALQQLADEGFAVRRLPVDSRGRIDPADLRRALATETTALVTLSLCNHELGNIYPIGELCGLSHEVGALFHCDAVQAVGRLAVDIAALDVDLLSMSAHKLFGPKGIGALYVRSAAQRRAALPNINDALPSLLRGGSQEKGRRAGTENVLGIVGFGAAAALCRRELLPRAAEIATLRDQLEARLLRIPDARRHGDDESGKRAPGTANLAFAGVEGELLFMNLDLRGIAVSTGAACSSGSPEPSPVLLALGLARDKALEALRFSLGPFSTHAEVEQVAAAVEESVALVRSQTAN